MQGKKTTVLRLDEGKKPESGYVFICRSPFARNDM